MEGSLQIVPFTTHSVKSVTPSSTRQMAPLDLGLKPRTEEIGPEVLYIELVEMMRDGEIARLLLEKIENH